MNDLGNLCSSTTFILLAQTYFQIKNNLNEMEDVLNSESSKTAIWLKAQQIFYQHISWCFPIRSEGIMIWTLWLMGL